MARRKRNRKRPEYKVIIKMMFDQDKELQDIDENLLEKNKLLAISISLVILTKMKLLLGILKKIDIPDENLREFISSERVSALDSLTSVSMFITRLKALYE